MDDYFFEGYRMTEYYDDYLGGHTEDFSFWTEILSGYQNVLEIACGTGRITLPLLAAGKTVTALDYAEEMLMRLREKASQYHERLTIINGDMREFEIGKQFDAIIITANSVNHLETTLDFERTLLCVARHLKKGGILVFDALNPEFRHLLRDKEHFYDHDSFVVSKTGERITVCENSLYDRATQISNVDYYYESESGKKTILSIKNRFYFPQELDYIVMKSPFTLLQKFGNYECAPFCSSSKEQIYLLRLD